ncbi:hypothetical protein B0J18DRAFT_486620 [Chaetomium sp. MPI-SDFR-AT-0129]|uniref:Uncharacterized protein n=1 Tax=Dichotomopilus funicola TaxID=1934379 RepID=A0AAN6ZRR9_9PEZI|nr:hypothetical protein B0J18DRAFT_486620 [Chaetomium sp. MPI-SDFR-AT-0129]KAK4147639.1 hypothetical protein C8A04DRAFT_24186 [Dichotomopilus funicola]
MSSRPRASASVSQSDARRSWRVNAYSGGRSVDFLSHYNVLENVRGVPTSVAFSAPSPYPTTVRCYEGPNGTGHMTAVNFGPNSNRRFEVGEFMSWEVLRRA